MKRLMLIGGGGHCHSVIDSIIAMNVYDEIGIIDKADSDYFDIRVIGTDDDIPELMKQGWNEAFITVGSIGDTQTRRRLFNMAKGYGLIIPRIIDPSAAVAKDAVIAEGSYIGKNATVNAGAVIGKCAIVNSGSIVEHDCRIGDFVHISPGAVLCGQVRIDHDTHIGAGTIIRQLINVGAGSMIGMGSIVVKDIPDHVKAYGNPCRMIERDDR